MHRPTLALNPLATLALASLASLAPLALALFALGPLAACNVDGLPGVGAGDGGTSLPDLTSPDLRPPDPPIACGRTDERVSFSATTSDGKSWSCTGPRGAPGAGEYDASIVDVSAGSFRTDSCPPNADCIGFFSTWNVAAPGLTDLRRVLSPGRFVHVSVRVEQPWGCSAQLVVTSLPRWGGEADPGGSTAAHVLLALSDGAVAALPNPDLTVDTRALGCASGPGCGGLKPDDYALRFALSQASPVRSVDLGMGRDVTLPMPGAATGTLRVRNLRSYQSAACDDYWNWAWYAVHELP